MDPRQMDSPTTINNSQPWHNPKKPVEDGINVSFSTTGNRDAVFHSVGVPCCFRRSAITSAAGR